MIIEKPILINGMGTVGSRVARLLLSMRVNVHGVKRSANTSDRKTQEILQLYREFGQFPIIVAPGANYRKRVKECKAAGLAVMESCALSEYKTIIDATSGAATVDHVHDYERVQRPYVVQGGTEFDVLKNDFVSAPGTVGECYTAYKRGARQVSCNTTFCSTALGLVLESVRPSDIKRVDMKLWRRCRDPGESIQPKSQPEMKASHHAADVMNVLPLLRGKVFSHANVNDWEHFHRTTVEVNFNEAIDPEKIKKQFRDYDRCIFLEQDIGDKDVREGINILISVSDRLKVPDGDALLPVYSIRQHAPGQIQIMGYTPQRSIVALSCVDWLWGALGIKKGWEEAFKFTNENVKWHGYGIKELKNAYEKALQARAAAQCCM